MKMRVRIISRRAPDDAVPGPGAGGNLIREQENYARLHVNMDRSIE